MGVAAELLRPLVLNTPGPAPELETVTLLPAGMAVPTPKARVPLLTVMGPVKVLVALPRETVPNVLTMMPPAPEIGPLRDRVPPPTPKTAKVLVNVRGLVRVM